jgi:hypothetical protein
MRLADQQQVKQEPQELFLVAAEVAQVVAQVYAAQAEQVGRVLNSRLQQAARLASAVVVAVVVVQKTDQAAQAA